MKKLMVVLVISMFIGGLLAGNENANAAKPSKNGTEKNDPVIVEVGKDKITLSKLEKAFQKNMNRKTVKLADASKDSVMDFVNLYVKYRLKVNDALTRGFDKDSSVLGEIEQNRKILAESYYYEKKLVEPHVAQWMDMRQSEFRIAIILNTFSQVGDTTMAFTKSNQAIAELNGNAPFADVAKKYSDDPESAKMGGLIARYITSGTINRELEEAVYKLNTGEYTRTPIRTKYGYFVIKVIEKAPRKLYRISHILLNKGIEVDSIQVIKKADEIYQRLLKGEDFNKLAETESDDPTSSKNGGYLGYYYSKSTGLPPTGDNLSKNFEDAIFSMKDGQYSKPLLTEYGWHIVRRDSTLDLKPENEKEELRMQYKRLYFNEDKKALNEQLAIEHGLKIDNAVLAEMVATLDTNKTTLDTAWASRIPSATKTKKLYSFAGKNHSVDEFASSVTKRVDMKGIATTTEGMRKAILRTHESEVFKMATQNLETEYPEFGELVSEFKDGILLFKVEAMEVWDKLKFDSVLARKFYDTTSMPLLREPHYNLSEIYVLSDSAAKSIHSQLKNGSISFENAAEQYTQRNGMRQKKGEYGFQTKRQNGLISAVESNNIPVGEISEPIRIDKGYSIIKVNGIQPKRKKTYEEAVPEIAPKVQDIMQKNLSETWLNSIRSKYSVKINDAELSKIFKK